MLWPLVGKARLRIAAKRAVSSSIGSTSTRSASSSASASLRVRWSASALSPRVRVAVHVIQSRRAIGDGNFAIEPFDSRVARVAQNSLLLAEQFVLCGLRGVELIRRLEPPPSGRFGVPSAAVLLRRWPFSARRPRPKSSARVPFRPPPSRPWRRPAACRCAGGPVRAAERTPARCRVRLRAYPRTLAVRNATIAN